MVGCAFRLGDDANPIASKINRLASGYTQQASRASQFDQVSRIQVLCRSDPFPAAWATRRRGRAQRLRQVQHHGRRALGAGRVQGVRAARRVDAGRDLQRHHHAQVGQPRQRRAGV